jgi:hypothetical protein
MRRVALVPRNNNAGFESIDAEPDPSAQVGFIVRRRHGLVAAALGWI